MVLTKRYVGSGNEIVIIAGKYKRKRFDSWPKSRLIFDPFRVYMLPSLGKTVVSHFDRPNGDAYGA